LLELKVFVGLEDISVSRPMRCDSRETIIKDGVMDLKGTLRQASLPVFAVMAAFAVPVAGPVMAQTQADPAPGTSPEMPTPAMTMEQVEAAYGADDFAAARAGLLSHAEGGDVTAQFRLGYMMANAMGGPFDRAGAIRWLESAIGAGSGSGALLLARVYLSGQPEVPDYTRAAALLQAEVDNNSAEAHLILGSLYRIGRGVAGDSTRAFDLLRKAAGANLPGAQFAISQMYARGEGVERDEAQATRWLLQAADGGYTQAQMSLYSNYIKGTGFPQDTAKAFEWLAKAVEGEDLMAKRVMGAALLVGDGLEADPPRGIALLAEAAEGGEPGAQSTLGYAYATGTGVAQNDAQAALWYQKAADQGLTRAADVVGDFYLAGRGVEVDLTQAERYFRIGLSGRSRYSGNRLGQLMAAGEIDPDAELELAYELISVAAEEGDEVARNWLLARAEGGEPYMFYRLGRIYAEGLGTGADAERAAGYLKKAADGKISAAQEQLSGLFASGTGVEQDYIEAHKWANIAAASGSETAAEQRDILANLMTADQVAAAQRRARDFMARP
jgi:hypothetical protein